jgi:hypothetical protein
MLSKEPNLQTAQSQEKSPRKAFKGNPRLFVVEFLNASHEELRMEPLAGFGHFLPRLQCKQYTRFPSVIKYNRVNLLLLFLTPLVSVLVSVRVRRLMVKKEMGEPLGQY